MAFPEDFGRILRNARAEVFFGWYTEAGAKFARFLREAKTDLKEVARLHGQLVSWQIFEIEYARRGYSPLSLEEFFAFIDERERAGIKLPQRIGEKVPEGETPGLVAGEIDLETLLSALETTPM